MTVEMLEQTTQQLEAAKRQVASANHAVSTANQQLKDTEERINSLASSGARHPGSERDAHAVGWWALHLSR
jgi:chromosome segregation ATPase